jgi:DNA-binding Lrp family transcriptional regulator
MAKATAHIDETDRRIIETLALNARAPTAEIARALGLSRTTVQSRLERLERSGLIAGYTVRLSEAHQRAQIRAYVMIAVAPKQATGVVAAIRRMSAIRLLRSVSGPFDLIAEAATDSAAEMDDLIDALGALEGVERTTSSIVLSTKIDR